MYKLLFMAVLVCLCCSIGQAMPTYFSESINFMPFDELFAYDKQPEYIIDLHIDVGPYSYNVFTDYTMQERQVIFQVCEKYLPWQYTGIQEQWERTMYMYQFVIKSPPPFPYPEYKLIPIPNAILLVLMGLITLSLRKNCL